MKLFNLTEDQLKSFLTTAWDLGHSCEEHSFKESINQRCSDLTTAYPWLFKFIDTEVKNADIPIIIKDSQESDIEQHRQAINKGEM